MQIVNLRKNHDEVMEHKTLFKDNLTNKLGEIPQSSGAFTDTFIVVDTNIFLSHLSLIQRIIKQKLNGKL